MIWSLRGSRLQPSLMQCAQGIVANALGSLALSNLRALRDPRRRAKQIGVDEVRSALERLRSVNGGGRIDIVRAKHSLTGLPLASILCRST